MLKGKTVYLRLFEPEDYEKTYIWHSDFNLMKSTCGPMRIVSKEIERKWVLSKTEDNRNELYLAICMNETDEMIGWYSISNIDHFNRACSCSGVIIGDEKYRNGDGYMEAGELAGDFIFKELNMRRVTGSCLREHLLSRANMEASNWKLEGIARQAIFKEGKYHDICYYSILKEEYIEQHKNYNYIGFIKNTVKISRELKIREKEYLDSIK